MEIFRQPRIKPHMAIIPHSQNTVELRNGVWNATSITLSDATESGRLYRVLCHLDGTQTPAEIAEVEGITRSDVEAVVDHLMQLDLLESGPSSALDYYLALLQSHISGKQVGESVQRVTLIGDTDLTNQIHDCLVPIIGADSVSLISDGPQMSLLNGYDDSWTLDGLARQQYVELFQAWKDDYIVYATSCVRPFGLKQWNRIALSLRVPWIAATIDGPFLLVGPTFVPHRSACFECLEARLLMNMRESGSYQAYKRALATSSVNSAPFPMFPLFVRMVAAHVSSEALTFFLTGSACTIGKLLAIHLPTMEFTYNEVLRLPGCPACGSTSEVEDRDLYFDLRSIIATND